MKGFWAWLVGASLVVAGAGVQAQDEVPPPPAEVREGVTFAAEPGVLYVPVREAAESLALRARWDGERQTALLEGKPVSDAATRLLLEGATLISVRDLEQWGAKVRWDAERGAARVTHGERVFWVRSGPKRVAVNRSTQQLRAWQGDRLVLETRVSTGAPGNETPTGSFTAGPYRAKMHYSSLYDNAPMPWSVQITGNIFFHGYHSVPPRAASHGCIRIPLWGGNAAKWLFEWIDNGTPVTIADDWPAEE
ncbi:MAG: L,D-transpeptidase family protein [Armatimonadota bacterium]